MLGGLNTATSPTSHRIGQKGTSMPTEPSLSGRVLHLPVISERNQLEIAQELHPGNPPTTRTDP